MKPKGNLEYGMRTIDSTQFGQAVDTSLFVTIAFAGTIPLASLTHMAISNYV
ncbi:MAG: VUT family protein [Peptococcaceae bacterium]|nr:VUT family protein [Peptococcaceae bacterium]